MKPKAITALSFGGVILAAFVAGLAIGGGGSPAVVLPPGPDCDVTLSDRMGMVIIRVTQAAPCDLALLRERAAAELARRVESGREPAQE